MLCLCKASFTSIMFLKFFHVVVSICSLFLLIVEYVYVVWIFQLFIPSLVFGPGLYSVVGQYT